MISISGVGYFYVMQDESIFGTSTTTPAPSSASTTTPAQSSASTTTSAPSSVSTTTPAPSSASTTTSENTSSSASTTTPQPLDKFQIQFTGLELCLDSGGAWTDGNRGRHECQSNNDNQKFTYNPDTKRLQNHEGKCLTNENNSMSWQDCGIYGQRVSFDDNLLKIENSGNNCLDVGNDKRYATCDKNNNWQRIQKGSFNTRTQDGKFQIKFPLLNKCLDSGGAWDSNHGKWDCDKTNNNQKFTYNHDTQQLKRDDGKCLLFRPDSVGGMSWGDCNGENDKVNFTGNILRLANNKCLDVGNNKHRYDCDSNQANQLLTIVN